MRSSRGTEPRFQGGGGYGRDAEGQGDTNRGRCNSLPWAPQRDYYGGRGPNGPKASQTISLPRSQSAKFVKKSQVFSRTFNPIWRVGPHSMAWGGQAAGESAEGTRHIASPCLDKLAHPIALVTARLSNRQHALESREMSERCN